MHSRNRYRKLGKYTQFKPRPNSRRKRRSRECLRVVRGWLEGTWPRLEARLSGSFNGTTSFDGSRFSL